MQSPREALSSTNRKVIFVQFISLTYHLEIIFLLVSKWYEGTHQQLLAYQRQNFLIKLSTPTVSKLHLKHYVF